MKEYTINHEEAFSLIYRGRSTYPALIVADIETLSHYGILPRSESTSEYKYVSIPVAALCRATMGGQAVQKNTFRACQTKTAAEENALRHDCGMDTYGVYKEFRLVQYDVSGLLLNLSKIVREDK